MKPDQLKRLVDARYMGEQALFTEACAIIAEANKPKETAGFWFGIILGMVLGVVVTIGQGVLWKL